jgi:hypothetical protein
MRFNLPYAAVGLALAIGAPAAHAQTLITTQPAPAVIAQPPIVTVPAGTETIQTTQTVRTVRAAPLPPVRRQIVTTRTITRRVMPATTTVVAGTVAAAPQPLYDVAPAAVATPVADIYPAPGYGYSRGYPAPVYGYSTGPLYDAAPAPVPPAPVGYSSYGYSTPVYDVAPAAVAPAPFVAAPVATQPVIYRYVYEPDRILVIDPITGIAVQAIPR